MRKTFVVNLALLILLNLLVKPFYILGIESEIQNRVGAETFGSYFALINFSFLLNILLDAGITNWNTRHISQNPQLVYKHFGPLLVLRLALAGVYLVVAIIISLFLNYTTDQIGVLILLALAQVFSSGILFVRSNLTGLHLFKYDSVISILDRLVLVLAMGYLLWFHHTPFRIEWLIWGQLIAYILTFLLALLFLFIKSGRIRLAGNFLLSVSALKSSFPFALYVLVSTIAGRIDSVILERIQGPQEAGIYAMGYRFFEAFNMMTYLFAVLLVPLFASMLKKKENIDSLLKLSLGLMLSVAASVSVACFVWQTDIMQIFYMNHTQEAAVSFGLLMIGGGFFAMQYVVSSLLTAAGQLKFLVGVAIGAMLINLTLNSNLIPTLNHKGAAISNVCTHGFIFLAQFIYMLKIMQPKLSRFILRSLAFIASSIFIGWIFQTSFLSTLNLWLQWLLFGSILLIGSFALGINDKNGLKQLTRIKS